VAVAARRDMDALGAGDAVAAGCGADAARARRRCPVSAADGATPRVECDEARERRHLPVVTVVGPWSAPRTKRGLIDASGAAPTPTMRRRPEPKPKPSRKHYARWTREDLVTLRAEWGEVNERTLRTKLGGRTWDSIAMKANRLGLANPSQGMVSLHEAMRISGMSLRPLRIALAEGGVKVSKRVRTHVERGVEHYRQKVVDPDAVVVAVRAYLARRAALLTIEEIATAHSITVHVARTAIHRLAAIRSVRQGVSGVSRVDAALAVEQHRDRSRCWRVPARCSVDACASRGAA